MLSLESLPLLPGTVLAGKYEIRGLIGSGGMSHVYEARNRDIDRVVAIKALQTARLLDPQALRRFLREARAAAAIHHENVVQVLDVVQNEKGALHIVQELLHGEDLRAVIDKNPSGIEISRALEIILPVVRGIAAAHAKGFVHRDIKPGNIFLAKTTGTAVVPKVLDFGVARGFAGSNDSTSTTSQSIVGTPAYMSPEQIETPVAVGPASDVWSLGVVFYELVTGVRPFEGPLPTQLMMQICTGTPRPVTEHRPDLPGGYAEIIHRCLEHDPALRFATADSLARSLSEAIARGGQPDATRALGDETTGNLRAVLDQPRDGWNAISPTSTTPEWITELDVPPEPPGRRYDASGTIAGLTGRAETAAGAAPLGPAPRPAPPSVPRGGCSPLDSVVGADAPPLEVDEAAIRVPGVSRERGRRAAWARRPPQPARIALEGTPFHRITLAIAGVAAAALCVAGPGSSLFRVGTLPTGGPGLGGGVFCAVLAALLAHQGMQGYVLGWPAGAGTLLVGAVTCVRSVRGIRMLAMAWAELPSLVSRWEVALTWTGLALLLAPAIVGLIAGVARRAHASAIAMALVALTLWSAMLTLR